MDKPVSVRRSTASVLMRNDKGDKVDMRSMMPTHQVKIAELGEGFKTSQTRPSNERTEV